MRYFVLIGMSTFSTSIQISHFFTLYELIYVLEKLSLRRIISNKGRLFMSTLHKLNYKTHNQVGISN